MYSTFAGKHVLLLQGPMGPFFWRLAKDLREAGARVSKINFCAGDVLYYPVGAISYKGSREEWPDFLSRFILSEQVDAVMLFGDCRPHHYSARHALSWLNTELYVFEEGYLRPDYITIERDGVNNHSAAPRNAEVYRNWAVRQIGSRLAPHPTEHAFTSAALYASFFSLANAAFAWAYPHYLHHRPLSPLREGWSWLRGSARHQWFRIMEEDVGALLTGDLSGRYFLVPLQVHNDSQVTVHSCFGSIENFMRHVVHSFAANAPRSDALVFKHHPMDRAYRDYSCLLERLSTCNRLDGRMLYVHDLHLPTLLKHARGTVVINSTVGLSSLHHGTPAITLGNPIYNIDGLTFQGSLAQFWQTPGKVDQSLYRGFREWLLLHNQANGNFYKPILEAGNHTGVLWPPLAGQPAWQDSVGTPDQLRARQTRLRRVA